MVETLKEIRANATREENFVYFKIFSYYVALPFVNILQKLKVSANTVTVAGILMSLPAAYCNLQHQYVYSIFLFHLFFLIDCIDGILARWSKSFSPLGALLDDYSHLIFHASFFISYAAGQYLSDHHILAMASVILVLVDNLHRLSDYILISPGGKGKSGDSMMPRRWHHTVWRTWLQSFRFPNVVVYLTICFFIGEIYTLWYMIYVVVFSTIFFFFTFIRRSRDLSREMKAHG